jgi:carboxymethylenebutenolidase
MHMDDALIQQARALWATGELGRRGFAVTALASGFALAVLPVSAQTITTDSEGLTAGEVQIPAQGGAIPGYRAMPAARGRYPTVLVVQEIFGVHEHIKDLCRRLAKAGYYAIAPELYARQGDVSKLSDIKDILTVVNKVPDAEVMADLDSTVNFAKASGSADTGKLAITGFCWGGRIVWLYTAHSPSVKAAVAWYGPLVGQPSELKPKNPIDIAKDLHAPVLGLYAGKDTNITAEHVDRMRAALKDAGKKAEIIVYPDAQHGFNADYRPSYNATDATDGWAKMLAFFKSNGVG